MATWSRKIQVDRRTVTNVLEGEAGPNQTVRRVVEEFVEVWEIELIVDADGLIDSLGPVAVKNKTKVSKEAGGLVEVRAVRFVEKLPR
jgi:hypothetical protein